mmetsp:Transcript_8073/g.15115  ORF Transcript_8073/g.15115 Transcript_8073/m.15115 type:complete len:205 (-) Transcript_8073:129-743(-)|eukprot:CAMPEP_0172882818 /NCGR_PEP_ID=MMETSP1075-20121228/121146_1 /TAXON_ID=2916 /ORGANISM="Ceratium fusus, Strain PA161109" /LENGTH=204 /DNA_ID=CAMNT_0013735577 /DNA_START=283 /DNA_END=897 /DNA_ORIENTATION=-
MPPASRGPQSAHLSDAAADVATIMVPCEPFRCDNPVGRSSPLLQLLRRRLVALKGVQMLPLQPPIAAGHARQQHANGALQRLPLQIGLVMMWLPVAPAHESQEQQLQGALIGGHPAPLPLCRRRSQLALLQLLKAYGPASHLPRRSLSPTMLPGTWGSSCNPPPSQSRALAWHTACKRSIHKEVSATLDHRAGLSIELCLRLLL